MQRMQNFTGIVGVNTQDRALQETMGHDSGPQPGAARHERPAPIIAMRKLLQEAVRVNADGGAPRGSRGEFRGVRAIDRILPADQPWTVLKPDMYPRRSRTLALPPIDSGRKLA